MDKNYYRHSGWIAGGPSREAMFDSLRLGLIVEIQFIFTDKEIFIRKAKVTSIALKNPLEEGRTEWIISMLFQENYGSKKMKVTWTGFYSTRSREGQITCELPKCFVR